MIQFVNRLFKLYFKKYQADLARHYTSPLQLQAKVLKRIVRANADTHFGRRYRFHNLQTPSDWSGRVPVHGYDELEPFILQQIHGQKALTATQIRWLAKTAGTTSGKSKYIPVTQENFRECHARGAWYAMAALHQVREDLQVFAKKNLLIGGGVYDNYPGTNVAVADISAIMIRNIPLPARPFYIPDVRTATLPDYEHKIDLIAAVGARENSITMLGGVPTWNLTLYRKILELTGAGSLLDVWPNLQAYIHGGVSFAPYREHFQSLIPNPDFLYLEVYNASEGFFAIQDRLEEDSLLLLLNNGIYYEFIPFEAYKRGERNAIPLSEVRVGEQYALVITSNNGLYRYLIGDLITFSSVNPYRLKIVGRTQEYINAFGEDLLLENAENALIGTCHAFNATIKDYTIAPYYIKVDQKGRHQWFVEFERAPTDLAAFTRQLDLALQKENSNYQQKRTNNLAIEQLELIALPPGFFEAWLRRRGKIGGQNKVPKLANHRRYAEEFLDMLATTS